MPAPKVTRPVAIEKPVRGPTPRLAQSRRKGLSLNTTDEVTLKRYLAASEGAPPPRTQIPGTSS